jgi:hypothetical protein
MKNGMDSAAVRAQPETESFGNRKLIRPPLSRESREGARATTTVIASVAPMERAAAKKTPPPDQLTPRIFYYQKQMQTKTRWSLFCRWRGDSRHHRWYDKHCIKVTRNNSANVLIYKPAIKYMFKEGEMVGRK